MSISDHVGILLDSSLDQARPSKRNPTPKYYARVAYPAAAAATLEVMAQSVAPNGSLAGLQFPIKRNRELGDKRVAGLPDDAVIVRFSTGSNFPPQLLDPAGRTITGGPLGAADLHAHLFAGARVRVSSYAFYYPAGKGDAGCSYNLSGIMAAGGGERMARGSDLSQYANPNAAPTPAPTPASAPTQASAPADANPFAAGGGSPF